MVGCPTEVGRLRLELEDAKVARKTQQEQQSKERLVSTELQEPLDAA